MKDRNGTGKKKYEENPQKFNVFYLSGANVSGRIETMYKNFKVRIIIRGGKTCFRL